MLPVVHTFDIDTSQGQSGVSLRYGTLNTVLYGLSTHCIRYSNTQVRYMY
eukprot:COSAG02_NODE_33093_length_505_cov_1.224138_1_plen_49_part_10